MKRLNNFTRRSIAALAVLITIMWCGAAAFAQTTAFTYQGKLTDGATAANGAYDLGFALFDAPTGGTQIGTAQTRAAVNVSNGVFTVQLDFGAAAFPGANRFLEIAVKRPADSTFTTLTPRQQLTSSPYSIRTLSAGAADALSANCVGCVTNAHINSVDGAKVNGSVANATTAQNAGQLGGVAANNFVQSDSNAFVRNQTTAQNADFNITGTGSIGGNVGIGTTATTTEALRVIGSGGSGGGGAGKSISLQGGNGGEGFSGFGGGGGGITMTGGNGGNSSAAGGAGGEIKLQSGNGVYPGGNGGTGITLQGGNGGEGSSVTNGGAGAGITIAAGNGGAGGPGRNAGNGAVITLQPGSGGAAGGGSSASGVSGNVILAPTNGNVGVGTTNPTSKLFVNGNLTVTGTINGTVTNAINATNATNAANADKLDNLDSTQFVQTTNTATFIRNQTTQQTGNFNISGNGTVGGDLNVNGTLNASLGQDATTTYGTGGLTVTRTSPNFTLVPGLTKTLVVPANTFPEIIISTDGGIRSNSTTSDGKSIVEVAIYVDGAILSSRQYHLTNASIAPSVNNWALTISQLLTPGSHTIEVYARSTSESFLSNATVSGGGGGDSVLRGLLTVTVIKR